MKKIEILEISLTNFKGIKNQKISFDKSTSIFGANGTGKTTIFDAFTFLLFGKDSSDRKDFEVKTLDEKNVVIPKIEHEVSAVIKVDDVEITISRVLKENWVKKRGAEISEFSGNVTEYYWDGVPMQQKVFQEKVSQILEESIFKMITNPLAFNSLKWQDRRNVLVQIAGSISDNELASGNSEYESLIAQLTNGKTLEDYRKQILSSIKKAKEDLKAIPTRIDEIHKSKPQEYDFDECRILLDGFEGDLKKLDGHIQDKSLAFDEALKEVNVKKSKVNSLKAEIQSIEYNSKLEAKAKATPDTTVIDNLIRQLSTSEGDLQTSENGLSTLKSKLKGLEEQLILIDEKIQSKRGEWAKENAKELLFDESSFCCPTCKRDFEASDIESKKSEMLTNFKSEKNKKLTEISSQGTSLTHEKTNIEVEIKALNARIENGKRLTLSLQEEVKGFKNSIDAENLKLALIDESQESLIYQSILSANSDYNSKNSELKSLESTIQDIPTVDISDIQAKRVEVINSIDDLKSKLRNEAQIKSVNLRIKELQEEEKSLAQQVANVEKTQFVIEQFNKLKIDTLEAAINKKFKFVKFRMFETQINGGESECCDALINGVPFSDANTASKINAGLDIINTLCEFYQVTAPIFIDNRESIIELIDCESQIVNLIVSGEDKKLRVA